MIVKFYNISKRQNSTMLPTGTATQYDCIIKDSCSIISPVIKLDIGVVTSPIIYNYAYIEDWGRYYFITNWTYNSRLWEASLSIDVLATYKTQIGNFEGYVLRSASRYNGAIADTTYPQKTGITGYRNKIKYSGIGEYTSYHTWLLGDSSQYIGILRSFDTMLITSGYYYVTILCKPQGSEVGTANKYNTYVMDYSGFAQFINTLFNTDYSSYSKGSLTNDVYKYIVDPLQWIVSVKWCPFRIPGTELADTVIQLGGLTSTNYTINAAKITDKVGMRVSYIIDNIPSHPDYSDRGLWVNNEPYIYIDLDCQPFGSVKLDRAKIPADETGNTGSITIMWDVDMHTGEALARIYAGASTDYEPTGVLLGTLSGNYMVDVPIAQTKTNAIGLLGSAISTVGNYLSGEQFSNQSIAEKIANGRQYPSYVSDYYQLQNDESTTQQIGGVLSNIGNVVTGANLSVSSRGTQGSYVGFRDPFIDCWWTSMVEEDNEHSGRPLCEKLKLNTLSGFILCRDGDISLNATQQEKGAVAGYLTGGFFYE